MNRIQSVDVIRLLGMIAVIAIHTTPFKLNIQNDEGIYKYLFILINQVSRFAVPFFFVISGYFWGTKVRNTNQLIEHTFVMAKRVGIVFFSWSFIYFYTVFSLFYNEGLLNLLNTIYIKNTHFDALEVFSSLLLQGTKSHLWFLSALLVALGICTVFIRLKLLKSLVVLSILLYIIGVLSKAYADTPVGIKIEFNTLYGPFFGTIFFTSGYIISGLVITKKWLIYGVFKWCYFTLYRNLSPMAEL